MSSDFYVLVFRFARQLLLTSLFGVVAFVLIYAIGGGLVLFMDFRPQSFHLLPWVDYIWVLPAGLAIWTYASIRIFGWCGLLFTGAGLSLLAILKRMSAISFIIVGALTGLTIAVVLIDATPWWNLWPHTADGILPSAVFGGATAFYATHRMNSVFSRLAASDTLDLDPSE